MVISLQFPLDIEDGWPPVGSESLPVEEVPEGQIVSVPPLFVKGLSVGDVIKVELDIDGFVSSWIHVEESGRSVVWVMRLTGEPEIAGALEQMRALGCNTTSLDDYGCHAVDVPADLDMKTIDEILDRLDPDQVAAAFPSMRHQS